jgi:hypothetical protein
MRYIKMLGLTLVAVFALASAVTATSAMALELPDLHILEGEAYPVTGEGVIKGAAVAELQSTLGTTIAASEVKVLMKLEALSALGPIDFHFTGAKLGTVPCKTKPDETEVILVPGEYHVIDLPVGGVLTPFILILFAELTIECNKLAIKVKPPAIAKLEKLTSGTDTKLVGAQPKCTKAGEQEFKTYFNDLGEEKTKQLLLINAGLGNELACELFNKEVVIEFNKMVDFLF